jgi:hypothetical protein
MASVDVLLATDRAFQRTCEIEHDLLKVMSSYLTYDEVFEDHLILDSWSGLEEMQDLMGDLKMQVQADVEPHNAVGWRALVSKMPGDRSDLHVIIDTIQTLNARYRHITTCILKGKVGPMDIAQRTLTLARLLSIWCNYKDVDINFRITTRVRKTLEEVYMRDSPWFGMSGTGHRYTVVASHDQEYMGHVFVREDEALPMVLGMIGIRSSIRNLVGRYCINMTHILVSGVVKWAKKNGYEIIRVQFPIGPMPEILAQMGFARGCGDYWIRVQDFGTHDSSRIWYENKRLYEIMFPPELGVGE